MKNFSLLALLSLLLPLVANAYDAKINGIYYNFSGDEAEVTYRKYPYSDVRPCYSEAVVIPESVTYKGKTYSVTRIGEKAFDGCSGLTSVTIPESMTSIGEWAFADCSGLASVTIPNSVTSIDDYAFSNCRGLTSVTIGKGVNSIGEGVFDDCSGLTSIIIPNNVDSIGGWAFNGCSGLTSISIPERVMSIESYTFQGCSDLTSITIPNSVTSIGKGAFAGCHNLTSITIPKSVTKIGSEAFKGCSKLTTIKGIHYMNSTGYSIFERCPFSEEEYIYSFQNYSHNRILPEIEAWQKKSEFESTAQYQARVSKENQQKKIQELLQEAIQEYTKEYPLKIKLGKYDADHELYVLNYAFKEYGREKTYLNVPLAEAPRFKDSFMDATFDATYIVTEKGLLVNEMTVNLNGKTYKTEQTATDIISTPINFDLPEVEIPLDHKPQQSLAQNPVTIDRSIDKNIPLGITGNEKTFAVIIGNEKYTQVAHVECAANDAKVFAEYCKKTLGMPEKNVRQYEDATFGAMLAAISDIKSIALAYNGNINVIFYYAGHGVPNETTHDAFLLPVDANGQQTEACYPVSRLYKELGELGAKNVTVFLDACFSGAQRGEGMLASARGVAIKPKDSAPQGKMVVFSAATGDETAYPYQEKGHGLFTYFLLKKLRDSKGDCTLGELGEYIKSNVRQQSVVINRKSQTPTIVPSQSLTDSWQTLKLK